MPSSVELICVDPKRVHEFWPHIKDRLHRAVERAQASDWENDVDRIMSGDALVWIAWDQHQIAAVATTELVNFNGIKHCYITGCGGEKNENWLHLIGELEKFAKDEGCKSIRTLGRLGFRRVLKGYTERLVLLEKEL